MSKLFKTSIDDLLSERYLSYAISTIISRSLPDVRDGLKPVHRRIIYSMYQLKLMHGSPYKKCARIVGDVMGKFHPHGDQAIYDSLVRMAQNFSTRVPLIEGQGNFGNIDGDNAAAMSYTEARLDVIANYFFDYPEVSKEIYIAIFDCGGGTTDITIARYFIDRKSNNVTIDLPSSEINSSFLMTLKRVLLFDL